jgi:hypothetical protein
MELRLAELKSPDKKLLNIDPELKEFVHSSPQKRGKVNIDELFKEVHENMSKQKKRQNLRIS